LDAKFSESFLLTWRSLTSLHVDGAKFEKGLYVNEKFGGQKESGQLLHLEMNIESRSEIGKVYFNGVAIRNTILRGLIVNSTVKFKNVKFNNIKIEDLSNGGKMSFDGLLPLEENSIFEMKDSEIGNTEFISMDFTKIKLKISNSQLINVKSFNSSWPSKILTVADSPSAEKEIFQQLKQALSSQGDKIQAFDFERREKQLHYQTLRWPKHFFDKFALLTSWTNDHGQNWIRPLMLLLASSGFFYILVIVRLRSITFYNIHWSIENVVKHLGFLLAFLNPLHSLTLFVGNLPSFGYSFLFDNLQRIFSGYFLFQLVTAFRKFMIRR
jgi:type VI protein secretion system component Hcp